MSQVLPPPTPAKRSRTLSTPYLQAQAEQLGIGGLTSLPQDTIDMITTLVADNEERRQFSDLQAQQL